jgi:hypothetical protein
MDEPLVSPTFSAQGVKELDPLDLIISKLCDRFPKLLGLPTPNTYTPVRHNLLACLEPPSAAQGTTIIMQAAPLKKYNGMSNSNVGDERLWFAQVVQHAHSTLRPLLYTLDAYTTHAANAWVQVKIQQSLAYNTQQLELTSKMITVNAVGELVRHGVNVSRLVVIDEEHIADSFEKTFLHNKQSKQQLAKKKLLKCELKMLDGQTLEDYITNFTLLLLEAGIDLGCPTTDHYPYIIPFQTGLFPRYSKLGHTDIKTPDNSPFPTLYKYWDFLRTQNAKDMARRENEEDLRIKRQHLNTLRPPNPHTPRPNTPQPNLPKPTNLKRNQHFNALTTPNKRHHTQENSQTPHYHRQPATTNGNFTDNGRWHTSMRAIPLNKTWNDGYKPPASMNRDLPANARIHEVMKLIFPWTSPETLLEVLNNTKRTPSYSQPEGSKDQGLKHYCVFHHTQQHGTFACPAFNSHYVKINTNDGRERFICKQQTYEQCNCPLPRMK